MPVRELCGTDATNRKCVLRKEAHLMRKQSTEESDVRRNWHRLIGVIVLMSSVGVAIFIIQWFSVL